MLQATATKTPSRIHHFQLATRTPIPPAPKPVEPPDGKKDGGGTNKGAIRPPQPLAKPPKKPQPGGGG